MKKINWERVCDRFFFGVTIFTFIMIGVSFFCFNTKWYMLTIGLCLLGYALMGLYVVFATIDNSKKESKEKQENVENDETKK